MAETTRSLIISANQVCCGHSPLSQPNHVRVYCLAIFCSHVTYNEMSYGFSIHWRLQMSLYFHLRKKKKVITMSRRFQTAFSVSDSLNYLGRFVLKSFTFFLYVFAVFPFIYDYLCFLLEAFHFYLVSSIELVVCKIILFRRCFGFLADGICILGE